MKLREIIEVQGWTDGSGWSYMTVIENRVLDFDSVPDEMDWDWWRDKPKEGEDVFITVKYF